jgi:hypothetical protein
LDAVPALAAAFGMAPTPPVVEGHAAGQQEQQDDGLGGADDDHAEEQQGEGEAEVAAADEGCSLQVLTAAALFGGWWGPTAEPGTAKGSKQALQVIEACLGEAAARAVHAMVK